MIVKNDILKLATLMNKYQRIGENYDTTSDKLSN